MKSTAKVNIQFSLLSIAIKLYSAIETADEVKFNQLHAECLGPIGYDKRCKKCR